MMKKRKNTELMSSFTKSMQRHYMEFGSYLSTSTYASVQSSEDQFGKRCSSTEDTVEGEKCSKQ
jgi:hypothetical protein